MTHTPDNGGPAFPLQPASMPETHYLGMSLRDYFAGQALAGLCTLDADCGPLGVAHDAYAHADAMLKAREVKP